MPRRLHPDPVGGAYPVRVGRRSGGGPGHAHRGCGVALVAEELLGVVLGRCGVDARRGHQQAAGQRRAHRARLRAAGHRRPQHAHPGGRCGRAHRRRVAGCAPGPAYPGAARRGQTPTARTDGRRRRGRRLPGDGPRRGRPGWRAHGAGGRGAADDRDHPVDPRVVVARGHPGAGGGGGRGHLCAGRPFAALGGADSHQGRGDLQRGPVRTGPCPGRPRRDLPARADDERHADPGRGGPRSPAALRGGRLPRAAQSAGDRDRGAGAGAGPSRGARPLAGGRDAAAGGGPDAVPGGGPAAAGHCR